VPLRSTEQVLIDIAGEAHDELILMTYSARPHPPVIDALCAARARGVRISVVVETLQGAGGALSGTEPAAAFRHVPGVQLWHWPSTARTKPASHMHAKIAVADRSVMQISSANLTQSAAESNIEAGLLVRGGTAPRRAAEHVAHLMGAGVLARLHPSG
jgi:phosphatidylserine/phosphatidylglycerophosphate/cardiolipin synthase-like enzyme